MCDVSKSMQLALDEIGNRSPGTNKEEVTRRAVRKRL
jgi:hypothetical protein